TAEWNGITATTRVQVGDAGTPAPHPDGGHDDGGMGGGSGGSGGSGGGSGGSGGGDGGTAGGSAGGDGGTAGGSAGGAGGTAGGSGGAGGGTLDGGRDAGDEDAGPRGDVALDAGQVYLLGVLGAADSGSWGITDL